MNWLVELVENEAKELLNKLPPDERRALCCDLRKAALKFIDLSDEERRRYKL